MLSLLTPQSQQNLTCSPGKGEPHSWQNLASGAEPLLLDTSDKGGISKMQALSTWIIRQYGPSPNIIQYSNSYTSQPVPTLLLGVLGGGGAGQGGEEVLPVVGGGRAEAAGARQPQLGLGVARPGDIMGCIVYSDTVQCTPSHLSVSGPRLVR